MKIVFIRSNPVDPDPRVEKEVNLLVKAGHTIKILAWDRSSNYSSKKTTLHLENGKVDIYRFGIPATFSGGMIKNFLPLLKFQLSLYLWLKKSINSFDAIHACDFDTAFISSMIAFKYKKKFIYDIYDYYIDAHYVPNRIKNLIEKKDHAIINNADAVIICSEKRKEQIAGTKPKRLVIIHNTPPSLHRKKLNSLSVSSDKVKIVYVGILDKGRLIKETVDIVKSNPSYEYHVAGFGRLSSFLDEMSKKYDNIFFYGKISYQHTLELENSCDMMTALYNPLNPNNYYAAPNKFYEALMLGKPLIMVRNTCMDKIVEDNKIGIVINYNKKSLEIAIEELVNIRDEWSSISKKMKIIYSTYYSWSLMEDKLLKLYA